MHFLTNLTAVGACALGREFGYEPNIAHQLIEAAGSIANLYTIPEQEREALLGPYSRFRGRLSDSSLDRARAEMKKVASLGHRFLDLEDERYPTLLMDCPDCPIGLYVRSNSDIEEIFDDAPCISIVGTRDISPYGDEWCKRIVHSLAEAPIKPVIVSGLAYGVDICAHQAALDAGLRTIAVIPTGIDDLYPYYHRRIADRIASTPGCALISDFPLKTSPQAATFLRRNRIIAGLSAATILVESKQKGGGMITCSTAFSYGREVWVLPGRIEDPRSRGCLELAGKHMAEIIWDTDQLPQALGLGRFERRRKTELAEEIRNHYSRSLGTEEIAELQEIAVHVKLNRAVTAEEIANALGKDFIHCSRQINKLCDDGFLQQDLLGRCSIVIRNA